MGLVNAKELELAKKFVSALAPPFDPGKLNDRFEERLRALIEARADSAIDAYQHGGPAKRTPVVDIMEALRKSIEMARKPPARESAKPQQRRSRTK